MTSFTSVSSTCTCKVGFFFIIWFVSYLFVCLFGIFVVGVVSFLFVCFILFWDRVFLCSFDCPGTHFVLACLCLPSAQLDQVLQMSYDLWPSLGSPVPTLVPYFGQRYHLRTAQTKEGLDQKKQQRICVYLQFYNLPTCIIIIEFFFSRHGITI